MLNLLYQIQDNCEVITRRSYALAYSVDMRDVADADFDDYAGKREDHLPKKTVERDLRRLLAARARLASIINKAILHLDKKRGRLPVRTWQDFHDVVDVIAKMCNRYVGILEGSEFGSELPIIEGLEQDIDDAFGKEPR